MLGSGHGQPPLAPPGPFPIPLDPTTTTTSPTPAPPSYKPEDIAELIKKIDDWKQKRDTITQKITDFNKEPSQFDGNNPVEVEKYRQHKIRESQLGKERVEVTQEWGSLLIEIGKLGGEVDEQTGDIVWPDGTRTSIRPVK
jgi:hypothetical protein